MWFYQGYSAQHCLIVTIEKSSHCLENRGANGALLTNLSKAFHSILRNLLIVKLAACVCVCVCLFPSTVKASPD